MSRFRIPALVDLITVSDPAQIADLAEDPRLDREYVMQGPAHQPDRDRSHSQSPEP